YALSREGARIIISSDVPDELARVKDRCIDLDAECHILEFDLAKPEDVRKAAQTIIEKFGTVDIFFSNGGIGQRSLVTETPVEIDRKIMEINFFSGIIITKTLLPQMIKNGGGHIVATASIAGDFGFPLRSAYCSSKHAVYGFYETVRVELKDRNIHVTIVSPGSVQTSISVHALDKNGKQHGKMDKGQAEGISPERCAKKILKAVRKNKTIAYIGGKELFMVWLKRFFPRIFYKIVLKINPT
ncbi:MAG: SDR family NAD(P)-dependent oxidoreductase, partial [Bacteroidetes bacterium]|nr:SDR family NAD(P)-dependent oxidoreductase [Bacteroidota bacterium]